MINQNNKSPRYHWLGLDQKGQEIKGSINAPSLVYAQCELQKRGIIIKKISKKHYSLIDNLTKKISSYDIALFSRQMATMIEAGIPLMQAFDIIRKGQTNHRMKELITEIKRDIETGSTFTEALNRHPAYFNSLFCNLIDAGEKSGSLVIMLNKVAHYQEKLESIRKKIKKIMAYPVAVLLIALLISAGLLIFVIPQFVAIFKTFGAELPFLTRSVICLSDFFKEYWYFLLGIFIVISGGFLYIKNRSPLFSKYLDHLLLKLPLLGSLILRMIIARFSRTLAVTLAAGLPLIEALQSAAKVTGNSVYQSACYRIQESISCGQPMQLALENTALFPSMVVQMIAIGEESGSLEPMLNKIADYYEEEINNTIESFNILLEPFIMAILGIVIGALLLAMYVPIFKLGSIM